MKKARALIFRVVIIFFLVSLINLQAKTVPRMTSNSKDTFQVMADLPLVIAGNDQLANVASSGSGTFSGVTTPFRKSSNRKPTCFQIFKTHKSISMGVL